MRVLVVAIAAASCIAAAPATRAEIPSTVSYQGVLRDGAGMPVPDGVYEFAFSIYDAATGGVALWTEVQIIAVEDGVFNAILGKETPLTLAFDELYWLGLSLEGGPEQSPRHELTSAPYALRAKTADIANDGDWEMSGDDVYHLGGSVGIGAVPPSSGAGGDSPRQGRGVNMLYVEGGDQTVVATRLSLTHDNAQAQACIRAERASGLLDPGSGFSVSTANSAIEGANLDGDSYSFGVAGHTSLDREATGGVLGADESGATWASLAYRDANDDLWGAYTPNNAHIGGTTVTGGFRMPTGAADAYVLTSDPAGVAAWAPPAATPDADWLITGTDMHSGVSGRVGIGTATPVAKLHVASPSVPVPGDHMLDIEVPPSTTDSVPFIACERGPATEFLVYGDGSLIAGGASLDEPIYVYNNTTNTVTARFQTPYVASSTHVVHAEVTGTGNYDAIAVYGESHPGADYGIGGSFSGGTTGVEGIGTANATGQAHGVYGLAFAADNTSYGVRGYAWGNGANYGVYGSVSGGSPAYAGYFAGNARVTGTLSKGGGSFVIDHPLDPANRYLYHSFVESPDMMNIYNGNAVLDEDGRATIVLPDWFEALNRDFRYQLTPVGAPAPNLHIAEPIAGNAFTIAGGDPGLTVSWLVTGIRHDPFADANRIPIEEPKPPAERGKYLHPEARGMPPSLGVDHEGAHAPEPRRTSGGGARSTAESGD